MPAAITPVDLSKVRLHSIRERKSKVSVKDFAKPSRDPSFASLLECTPNILAGSTLREAASDIRKARSKKKAIMWALGAHVIKCGLSPLIIDLMDAGFVSSVALNGGGLIHDTEIALYGETSEDVPGELSSGRFGMVKESGEFINSAVSEGAGRLLGLGESVGKRLIREKPDYLDYSIIAACVKRGIPVTVHVAIGTDIIHTHPSFDASATGAASHRDFRLYAAMVPRLSGGGVYLNVGSAVVLPEVFLKAVSLSRNLGKPVSDFTSLNLDFARQYRAHENVLIRPGGKPISIVGHHELTIPLLYKMLVWGGP